MNKVQIIQSIETKTRVVRLRRTGMFSAVPFVGVHIWLSDGPDLVDNVTFRDGGGIEVITEDIEEENGFLDELLEIMIDDGWIVLSNVEKPEVKWKKASKRNPISSNDAKTNGAEKRSGRLRNG